MTDEMRSNDKVISVLPTYGNKKQRDMKGIRGIYQVLLTKENEDTRKFYTENQFAGAYLVFNEIMLIVRPVLHGHVSISSYR